MTAPLAPGTAFGKHRVDGLLGRGGMAVVYRATHLELGRVDALKLIAERFAADPDYRTRFRREARLVARLEHPRIVPVYDAGEHEGQLFIVMRLIRGTDLRRLIMRDGPLVPGDAVELVGHVAEALDAAHACGLVHRDVKPDNVLIETVGGRRRAFLTDFGVATSHIDTHLTLAGQWVGTQGYAAPEQIGGRAGTAADVYALAGVLNFLLTGDPPDGVRREGALHDVIRRGLATDPADRHPSAGAFARAAQAAIERTPDPFLRVLPEPFEPVERPRRRRPPRRAAVVLAGVAVAIGAGAATHGEAFAPWRPATPTEAPRAVDARTLVNDAAVSGGKASVVAPDGSVVRVDTRTGRRVREAGLAGADRIAVSGDDVWVGAANEARRLGSRPVALRVGALDDLAVDGDAVWVLDRAGQQLTRMTAAGEADAPLPVGPEAVAVAMLAGAPWVLDAHGGLTAPVSGHAVASGLDGGDDLAAGAGSLYVLDRAAGKLARVDPSGGAPPIIGEAVAHDVVAIGYGDERLWLAREHGTLTPISPGLRR